MEEPPSGARNAKRTRPGANFTGSPLEMESVPSNGHTIQQFPPLEASKNPTAVIDAEPEAVPKSISMLFDVV